MTKEQYERWVDFALRMARTYPGASKKSRAEVERIVVCLIDWIICNVPFSAVHGWEETDGDNCASSRCDDWLWTNGGGQENDHGEPVGAYKRWLKTYGNRALCCVRAGIDMAVEPSAGVSGFTVGDLKQMYPEGIPAWVSDGFMGDDGKPLDLNAQPDSEGVWL